MHYLRKCLKILESWLPLIPSLGTPSEGKSFRRRTGEALEIGLKLPESLVFKTVNLDNYCGYAEMGEGEEIVGIAGHLDIVPVGGDWTYDPFKLTRDGDHVYGTRNYRMTKDL